MRASPTGPLTEQQQCKRLVWLLEDRARLVRMVGLTCWSELPEKAKEAFDSFAPILDQAAEVIAAVSARAAALEEDIPEVSSVGTPGLEVLTWRGKTYVESHRDFLS